MRSAVSTFLRFATNVFRAPRARRLHHAPLHEVAAGRERPQASDERAAIRQRSGWILFSAVLLFAAMAAPYFRGMIYAADDLWAFHLPIRAFYAQCLQAGVAFDWMPQLYSGFFLTGEGQGGVYHPVHWLLYAALPLRTAFNLEILLPYPLLFAGTYVWLRRRIRRIDAALFGALCFAAGSFSLLHFVHPNAMAIVAHVPWCLWSVDVALTSSAARKQVLADTGLALLIASQVLLGYPQYVWFCMLAMACYGLWIANSKLRTFPWCRLLLMSGFVALGTVAGAIQLLPTFDALAQSTRQAASAEFANTGALHLANMAQLVAPYALQTRVFGNNTHELGCYLGAVPLVLLVWLAVNGRHLPRRHRKFAVAAAGCAGIMFLLCLGQSGGLYALQTKLPLVGRFRLPARYLVLVNQATSGLAAVAFAGITRPRKNSSQSKQSGSLSGLVVTSVVVSVAIFLIWRTDRAASLPLIVAGPVLIGAGVWLVSKLQAKRSWAALVILFTAIDLGIYGLSYAVWPGAATADDVSQSLAANVPSTSSVGRILIDDHGPDANPLRTGNQAVLAGTRLADGYAGLEPANVLPLDNLPALRLAGVTHVANHGSNRHIAGLNPSADERWLTVADSFPRARLLTRTVAATAAEMPGAIAEHNLAEVAIVESAMELDGPAGTAICEIDQPGCIRVAVQAPGKQLLVVNERFHPGWKCTVNGQLAPVVQTYGQYLGCVVDSHTDEVDFRFVPDSLTYGKWITWAALALIVGLTLSRLTLAGPHQTNIKRLPADQSNNTE